jgi:hypothetical protein
VTDAAAGPPSYQRPPPPPPPPPLRAAAATADDPNGMGAAVLRLSPASYHAAVPSLTVLASRLDQGELVEVVAQGMVNEVPGIVAVTDRRVAVVNGRQWRPDIVETIYVTDLVVQGWQDQLTAALSFTWAASRVQIDRIFDVHLAHEVAKRVRAKVVTATGPGPV